MESSWRLVTPGSLLDSAAAGFKCISGHQGDSNETDSWWRLKQQKPATFAYQLQNLLGNLVLAALENVQRCHSIDSSAAGCITECLSVGVRRHSTFMLSTVSVYFLELCSAVSFKFLILCQCTFNSLSYVPLLRLIISLLPSCRKHLQRSDLDSVSLADDQLSTGGLLSQRTWPHHCIRHPTLPHFIFSLYTAHTALYTGCLHACLAWTTKQLQPAVCSCFVMHAKLQCTCNAGYFMIMHISQQVLHSLPLTILLLL